MSLVQSWRRFTFFDRVLVKDPDNPDQAFAGFQGVDIQTICAATDKLIVGAKNGLVHFFDKDWTSSTFKAYDVKLDYMTYLRLLNTLITIGNDDAGFSLLKVWNLDVVGKQNVPFCSRISKLSLSTRSAKVSALAVHPSLQFMAIGYDDGSIQTYQGDLTREKHSNRPHVLRDGLSNIGDGAISNLLLSGSVKQMTLYAISDHSIHSYTFIQKEKEPRKILLDKQGCRPKCSALGDEDLKNPCIVARNDSIVFYEPDFVGQQFVFEGEKLMIATHSFYLLVVCKDSAAPSTSEGSAMQMLTIYDIPNSYIAYSAPIPEICDVVYAWNGFIAVSKNGKVYRIIEKETQQKLEILFRKNLYDLAISLAKRLDYDEEGLAEIFKQYGDYQYMKADYEGAIQQYIKSIGKLEASYVIRKFLDAQRIIQLTDYLEALHKAKLANKDHTTILLNCYAKLNRSEKLADFISMCGAGDVAVDVETAIRVLRNAGFTKFAAQLAEQQENHAAYLRIKLEDQENFGDAIKYISNLSPCKAVDELKRYGKLLLEHCPEETTELLKQLCSFNQTDRSCVDDSGNAVAIEDFIPIFIEDPVRLESFLEHVIQTKASESVAVYNTLLELYLRKFKSEEDILKKSHAKEKIIRFLAENDSKYELDHALVLCHTYQFSPGTLFVFEKSKLYRQILQHYMDAGDDEKVIETCKLYGNGQDPTQKQMWHEALWYFAKQTNISLRCLSQLVQHIDQERILPPMMVLEILSHSSVIPLSVVKEYLLRWLAAETEKIKRAESEIDRYKKEIEKDEALVRDLKENSQTFQISKCSACDHDLEVPSVHFLCKHAFHQHCFESYAESGNECPSCLPERNKLRAEISTQQANNKDLYQQFRSDLQTSNEVFGTITDYFAKGAFSKPTVSSAQRDIRSRSLNPFEE